MIDASNPPEVNPNKLTPEIPSLIFPGIFLTMPNSSTDCGGGCSREGGGGGSGGNQQQQHTDQAPISRTAGKGKSCTGCLYYSSLSKQYGRNPRCLGFTRTIPQVPLHRVGETEMEANEEGHDLSSGFKYSCIGYSMFLDSTDNLNHKGDNRPELPSCVGIEILVAKPSSSQHVPSHVHHKEDGTVLSQPQQSHKPPVPSSIPGDEFFSRFTRHAGLVASGVAKNLKRVGNYVKDTLDDMMSPYGRRPK